MEVKPDGVKIKELEGQAMDYLLNTRRMKTSRMTRLRSE